MCVRLVYVYIHVIYLCFIVVHVFICVYVPAERAVNKMLQQTS